MNKKELMTWRNKAMKAVNQGKLDAKRVNKAFGILQSKDAEDHLKKYNATHKTCNCPDHSSNHVCKHMIARMMQYRAKQQ